MADVISRDGTRIGYQESGDGPPLILVDGALGFRGLDFSQKKLAPLLEPRFTVVTYDRRGRGESGDSTEYAVRREVDDLEALIEAVGGSAGLYGISSGGALVLETALRAGDRLTGIALFEAPYDDDRRALAGWRDYRRRLALALSEGRRGDAVALFMAYLGAPEEQIAGARQSPVWPALESVAPTLVYDAEVLGPERAVPVDRVLAVRVPALVMSGSESRPFMRETALALARALPDGRYVELAGQRHDVDPAVIAPVLTDFFEGVSRRAASTAA